MQSEWTNELESNTQKETKRILNSKSDQNRAIIESYHHAQQGEKPRRNGVCDDDVGTATNKTVHSHMCDHYKHEEGVLAIEFVYLLIVSVSSEKRSVDSRCADRGSIG